MLALAGEKRDAGQRRPCLPTSGPASLHPATALRAAPLHVQRALELRPWATEVAGSLVELLLFQGLRAGGPLVGGQDSNAWISLPAAVHSGSPAPGYKPGCSPGSALDPLTDTPLLTWLRPCHSRGAVTCGGAAAPFAIRRGRAPPPRAAAAAAGGGCACACVPSGRGRPAGRADLRPRGPPRATRWGRRFLCRCGRRPARAAAQQLACLPGCEPELSSAKCAVALPPARRVAAPACRGVRCGRRGLGRSCGVPRCSAAGSASAAGRGRRRALAPPGSAAPPSAWPAGIWGGTACAAAACAQACALRPLPAAAWSWLAGRCCRLAEEVCAAQQHVGEARRGCSSRAQEGDEPRLPVALAGLRRVLLRWRACCAPLLTRAWWRDCHLAPPPQEELPALIGGGGGSEPATEGLVALATVGSLVHQLCCQGSAAAQLRYGRSPPRLHVCLLDLQRLFSGRRHSCAVGRPRERGNPPRCTLR
jgi:hypothetical protein